LPQDCALNRLEPFFLKFVCLFEKNYKPKFNDWSGKVVFLWITIQTRYQETVSFLFGVNELLETKILLSFSQLAMNYLS